MTHFCCGYMSPDPLSDAAGLGIEALGALDSEIPLPCLVCCAPEACLRDQLARFGLVGHRRTLLGRAEEAWPRGTDVDQGGSSTMERGGHGPQS